MLRIGTLLMVLLLAFPAQAQTYKTKTAMQSEIATQLATQGTQAITAAILRTVLNDMSASYDQVANGVNAQTGTSYALAATDAGQLVTFSNAAAIAVTIVQANTAGFTQWNAWVCNIGTAGLGVVTITPTVSTIGGQATLKLGFNSCAKIISDGANYQVAQVTAQGAQLSFTLFGVNFNSANTDNQVGIVLPAPYNFYLVNAIYISNASHTLVTATCGVFTAAAGGGTAIVTSASAITVSGTASGAANSAQSLAVVGANTVNWSLASVPTLFFRVQTAEGAAATGSVTIVITPVG